MVSRAVIHAFLCIVLFSNTTAFACRYTVRDIGFVAIRGPEFSLVLRVNPKNASRFEAIVPELKRTLANSNIEFQAVIDDKAATADGSENDSPTLVLVDRNGGEITIEASAETLMNVDLFQRDIIERNFGKVLRKLCDNSLDSFAHIVVLEGTDSAEATRVRAMVEEAVGAIRKIEPMLPRPIAHPMRVVFLSQSEQPDEKLLVWALCGRETSKEKELTVASRVAVVYGKGRLAGNVLVGDEISVREILGQLALVGESCECETSREWMKENSIPFLWNAKQAQAAPNELGFDPNSPLVRAEMIRIISQGPKAKSDTTASASSGPNDAIERLLIGYSEATLAEKQNTEKQTNGASTNNASNISNNLETSDTDREISSVPALVNANVKQGNSWDFDEPNTDSSVRPEESPSTNEQNANKIDLTDDVKTPVCEECVEGERPSDFSTSPSSTLFESPTSTNDTVAAIPTWAVIAATLSILTLLSIALASWILFLK